MGKVKQGVAEVTGDADLAAEGAAQENKGAAQKAVGNAKEAVKKTGDAINKKL